MLFKNIQFDGAFPWLFIICTNCNRRLIDFKLEAPFPVLLAYSFDRLAIREDTDGTQLGGPPRPERFPVALRQRQGTGVPHIYRRRWWLTYFSVFECWIVWCIWIRPSRMWEGEAIECCIILCEWKLVIQRQTKFHIPSVFVFCCWLNYKGNEKYICTYMVGKFWSIWGFQLFARKFWEFVLVFGV